MTFEKGVSGNPAGRPKGSCNKLKLFKEMVEPRREELIQYALDMAMSPLAKEQGRMLCIFLERLLPAVVKDNILSDEITLSEGTLVEQANHIRNLITDKHITPEQGNVLLASIKTTAEIKYKEDLEKELEDMKTELKELKTKLNI